MTLKVRSKPASSKEVLQRYPRLTGHLICESLGYFTPGAAANAIKAYIEKRPCYCEWYTHMAGGYSDEKVLQVGIDTLKRTFRNRHHHRGYMAEYAQAKMIVDHVLAGGKEPEFASWF